MGNSHDNYAIRTSNELIRKSRLVAFSLGELGNRVSLLQSYKNH